MNNIFNAILGICKTKPAPDNSWIIKDGKAVVELDKAPILTEKDGAAYLAGKGLKIPVLVIRGGDGVLRAFQNKCTHAGRKIDPVQGQSALRCCSINHSTFDYNGKKLTGPAKHDIARFSATESGNCLIISLK